MRNEKRMPVLKSGDSKDSLINGIKNAEIAE